MSKKRLSSASKLRSFFHWFVELPPAIIALVVGGVVVGTIFAILPPSLFHSFNCKVSNLPQNSRSSNGYFIDNQVIVVGPKNDVEAVIGTPSAVETPVATPTVVPAEPEKVILNLIEGCDLSYLNSRKELNSNSPVEERQLVMRLYEIPDTNEKDEVEDVIADIDSAALIKQADISVDPNYLTRLADFTSDPCAHPSDPGGSGGGPFGEPGTANPARTREAFMNQWAFGSQGVNLPPSTDLTGRRVRVGVFDTSPYRINLPFFKWIATGSPSPLWFTNWDAGGTTMMSNHGLFVAELIHAIAPKSHIQLIRVLNEDGCGELWALNKGLEAYMSRMSAWTRRMDKTVINMSLGIRLPTSEEDNDTGSEHDVSEQEDGSGVATVEVNGEGNEDSEIRALLLDEDVETLKSLIDEAHEMGAIIVASAGNNSKKTKSSGNIVEQIGDMQIPASYSNVIGVVATNQKGERSCYSNKGVEGDGDVDVAAPGGDGGEDPENPNNLCISRASTWNVTPGPNSGQACTDIANCEYVVVSLGQTRYGPQYMLWSGTSFAAPLVSGFVTLLYEQVERDQIDCLVREGGAVRQAGLTIPDPELGWGLIDISKSLSPTVLSSCGILP